MNQSPMSDFYYYFEMQVANMWQKIHTIAVDSTRYSTCTLLQDGNLFFGESAILELCSIVLFLFTCTFATTSDLQGYQIFGYYLLSMDHPKPKLIWNKSHHETTVRLIAPHCAAWLPGEGYCLLESVLGAPPLSDLSRCLYIRVEVLTGADIFY